MLSASGKPVNFLRRTSSSLVNLVASPTRSIWIPILLGLGIREIFAPFTGHPFDFELWIRLGYYTTKAHLDPYTATPPVPGLSIPGTGFMTWIGYPPFWPFFQAGIYSVYSFIGINNRFVDYFLIKQPMVLADILAGYLIFRIVEDETENRSKAIRAMAFWLLCPYTIVISAVWGMFDQIVLDLVLISTVFVSKTVKSALVEALGIFIKAIPAVFLPVLALAQVSKKRIIIYLIISVGVSASLSLLPYVVFRSWNLSNLEGVGISVTNKVGGSINYWDIIGQLAGNHLIPLKDFTILGYFGYLWIPAVILGSVYCAHKFRKKEDPVSFSGSNLYLSALFVFLIFLLVRTQINEQYVIYFFGLGLIDVFTFGGKRFRKFNYVWLSSFAFLIVNNVYMVRFLEPLSIEYLHLDTSLENGFPGEIRNYLLIATAILFTISAFVYIRSIFLDIRQYGTEKGTIIVSA